MSNMSLCIVDVSRMKSWSVHSEEPTTLTMAIKYLCTHTWKLSDSRDLLLFISSVTYTCVITSVLWVHSLITLKSRSLTNISNITAAKMLLEKLVQEIRSKFGCIREWVIDYINWQACCDVRKHISVPSLGGSTRRQQRQGHARRWVHVIHREGVLWFLVRTLKVELTYFLVLHDDVSAGKELSRTLSTSTLCFRPDSVVMTGLVTLFLLMTSMAVSVSSFLKMKRIRSMYEAVSSCHGSSSATLSGIESCLYKQPSHHHSNHRNYHHGSISYDNLINSPSTGITPVFSNYFNRRRF